MRKEEPTGCGFQSNRNWVENSSARPSHGAAVACVRVLHGVVESEYASPLPPARHTHTHTHARARAHTHTTNTPLLVCGHCAKARLCISPRTPPYRFARSLRVVARMHTRPISELAAARLLSRCFLPRTRESEHGLSARFLGPLWRRCLGDNAVTVAYGGSLEFGVVACPMPSDHVPVY